MSLRDIKANNSTSKSIRSKSSSCRRPNYGNFLEFQLCGRDRRKEFLT